MPAIKKLTLGLKELLHAFLTGKTTPEAIIETIYHKIETHKDYNIWIHVADKSSVLNQVLENKKKLEAGIDLPLFCIPFAVKDNIDVAGMPTTAACPNYEYIAEENSDVVQQLVDAGAIVIGKTNLDQFATGLVGVRSPYGAVKNSHNPAYISGGSSSGSALAIALGMSCFSLGTDTAGSGRVPAGFNDLVGLKPGIGKLSTKGVVPACKSLDCVSVFTSTIEDADFVYDFCTIKPELPAQKEEIDQDLVLAFPAEKDLFFCEGSEYKTLFASAKEKISNGFSIKDIAFDVFNNTAKLLYHGPWIAERMAAVGDFIEKNPDDVHPVVGNIIEQAKKYSATDTFKALYKLEEYRLQAKEIFKEIDCLVVPTTPGIFTIEEVEKNPIELNTQLGYYTNYVNLLGLCAVAIPADFTTTGLPFGITVIASENNEKKLLKWVKRISESLKNPKTENGNLMELAVAGLHKKGQPLNHQLTDLNAVYAYTVKTSPTYKMFLLTPETKAKPGLVKLSEGEKGHALEVEVWKIPVQNLGKFMVQIPHPLGIGKVELENGKWVYGFICEEYISSTSKDISEFISWEAFLASN